MRLPGFLTRRPISVFAYFVSSRNGFYARALLYAHTGRGREMLREGKDSLVSGKPLLLDGTPVIRRSAFDVTPIVDSIRSSREYDD